MWASALKSHAVARSLTRNPTVTYIFRHRTIRGVGRCPYLADQGSGYIEHSRRAREYMNAESLLQASRRRTCHGEACFHRLCALHRGSLRRARLGPPERIVSIAGVQQVTVDHAVDDPAAEGRPSTARHAVLNLGTFLLVGLTFSARQLTLRTMDKVVEPEIPRRK